MAGFGETRGAHGYIRRSVTRREDMSATGKLQLIEQMDGDIIVTVWPDGEPFASVEFCTSGGKSPKTLHALRALLDAIVEENGPQDDRAP